MPLLRVGRDNLAALAVNSLAAGQRAYSSTGAVLFIATSTEAHSAASTWFAVAACGSTMESGYPIISGNVLQFRGVYATDRANGQIEEWGIHNATVSSTGNMLNLAPQQVLGTKTCTQSWQITTCVTITT